MKLILVIILITSFQVLALPGNSQKRINLELKNEAITSILRNVEKKYEYRFIYNDNLGLEGQKVDVYAKNATIDEFMYQLLKATSLSYKKVNRGLVVIIGEALINSALPITGTIINEQGELLAGVSVIEKGTSNGVTTADDGSFNIQVKDENAILVISRVGYLSQEISVKDNKYSSIILVSTDKSLEEIVVVGYGTQKRKDVTGAIASVKLENSPIALLPNVNLLDALKGSLPGFDIGAVTTAGSNPSINIRGQNSIRASNTPLVILDGAIFLGSFNELNPADIASIDVLKDASATAIYGSLAANGVVLVTTKKGRSEKPTIQLNGTGGVQTYTNRPNMLSPEGYLKFREARFLADNPGNNFDPATHLAVYEYEAYKEGRTIDWFDEVTRLAPFQNYTLSVSGATNRINYYVSGNYMNQKGIVLGDQFRRYTAMAKLDLKITDWLKTGFNFGFTDKNADGIPAHLEYGTISSPYGYMNVHDRGTVAPGFEDFLNQLERYPQGQTTTANPFWRSQEYNEDRNQNYRSISFARIDLPWDWSKGLSYTFNYSINKWEGHAANFQGPEMFMNTMLLPELTDPTLHLVDANGGKSNTSRTDWYLNHLINYNRTFGDHSFDLTLLEEEQSRRTNSFSISARDFSTAGTTVLGVNSLELGNSALNGINSGYSKLNQMASMARLNYVYKNKYYASFSIRQDGYSGYAEGHKYGVFRAGALAWTVSEEPFIKNNADFIDQLKLRLSYGENGNPSVGAYSTFPGINSSNTILLGGNTQKVVYLSNLANKNLDWEKTTALNLGLDFAFFKNRLSGTINLYKSNTTNLLLARSIPIMNGFNTVLDNIGKVDNKGLEIQINTQNIVKHDFYWHSGFNYWINRNKVVSLYGLDADGDGVEDDDASNSLFIGKSLGAVYTYVMDGIIQKNDAEFIAIYGGQPGDVKFRDLNNDGKINGDDRTIVGYSKPNYTFTLSNTIGYKNIELYFLFNYIAGNGKDNWYMGNNVYPYVPSTLYAGSVANWLDKPYWSVDNPSNTVTRINYNNSAYGYGFPKPRQFVRLQDVALSYTLPTTLLSKLHISSLKVFASGKNLLTFSNWEGLDPESATTFAGVNGFPVFKIFTFGINASF
ncbi:MAG: TonB-dependent receptor [Niabella sp.]